MRKLDLSCVDEIRSLTCMVMFDGIAEFGVLTVN